MIKGQKHLFYEKLREIKAFSMVKRSLKDGMHKRKREMVTSHRTEGNRHKLKNRKLQLNIRKVFLIIYIGQTLENVTKSIQPRISSKNHLMQPCVVY